MDSHADDPITSFGLADPPNKAPTTETTSEADEAPFATKATERVAGCTGKVKAEAAILR